MQRRRAVIKHYRRDIQRLADNLKLRRRHARYSQVALAKRARIKREYVSLIERRLCNPSLQLLTYIAAGLGIQTAHLFYGHPASSGRADIRLTRGVLKQRLSHEYLRLAANVQRYRIRKGWSQETFSQRTDTHRTFVSLIERGRTNPSLLVLCKLAVGMHIKTENLLSDPSVGKK